MKKYYLENEKKEEIFVGYKVKNLFELAEAGYFINRSFHNEFFKYRKKGIVYVDSDFNFLYFKNESIIPVNSKERYALNWEDYLKECM